jgi:hypothetical protein
MTLALACCTTLFPRLSFGQGSLTPPPGPPGPTMKTLTELEAKLEKRIPISSIPLTISQPGSYYLTQDVVGPNGITVAVINVTIDLNGFTILGPGKGAGGSASAIHGGDDLLVRNGRIRGWPGDGVAAGAAAVIESLDIVSIGGSCITAGEQTQVRKCRVGAGNYGIVVTNNSVVDSCISIGNTVANPGAGIVTGSFGTVFDCASSYNTGSGIGTGDGSNISRCVASNNHGAAGIQVGSGCVVTDSIGRNNGTATSGSGIAANAGTTIAHCTVSGNKGYGVFTNDTATIAGCTSLANSSSGGFGIGIRTGSDSSISGCTVNGNTGDGIQFINRCLISGNLSSNNGKTTSGGDGLHSFGTNNRIDSNLVRLNAGAQIDNDSGGSDTIIRNNVDGGGAFIYPAYSSTAGHNIAPSQSPDSATNPFANFVY